MQTGGRRIMLAAGLAMACLLPAGVAGAQEEGQPPPPVPARIGAKFVRGMTNLTTGFGEFPKQIYLIGRKEGWVQGTFRGPVEGLGMFIARTVAGAYEVVTFLIPVPSGYQPMLLPEYVWQPEPTSQVTMPAAEPAAPMLAPDNR